MILSEFEQKRIEKLFTDFGRGKVPACFQNQLRIEFRIKGAEVTLYESRPHYLDQSTWFSMAVARFKKDPKSEVWELYCADRNGKWHLYKPCPPNRDIEKLLAEVKNDPTGIFWG